MKTTFICFFYVLVFHLGIYGQTVTLINSSGDGGFETGSTFSSNGWTTVNPGTYANWQIGTASSYFGSRGAFIGGSTTSNSYSTAYSRTCHLYKDVTIPSGATSITLSWYMKGNGELGYDRLLVYTAPTSVTPVANNPISPSSAISGATLQYAQSSFFSSLSNQSISLTGATGAIRIIFTWQNDYSGGTQPPISLDNVSLTYIASSAAPYCTPTYTNASASCSTYGMGICSFLINGSSSTRISDYTTCTGTGYENKTSMSVSLARGNSYSTTISNCSSSNAMNCQTWIDFNNNNSFETSESVGGLNAYYSGTFNLTIPPSASTGTHRMRVITSFNGSTAAYPTLNPCSSGYLYGNARDYTVNVTPGTSCTGTPSTGTLSSTITSGCSSYSATISALGTTTGTGISYQWQSSSDTLTWSNISGATNTFITVSIVATKFYRLKTICSYSGISSISPYLGQFLIMFPYAGTISGLSAVCVGATTSLYDSVRGGTWTSGNTSIATINSSGSLTGVSPGSTIITYTIFNSCGTAIATFPVNVNPLPYAGSISGRTILCPGNNTTLTSTISGGVWNSGSPSIATINSAGMVTGVSLGNVNISYTVSNSCGTSRAIFPLTIMPPPNAGSITGATRVCIRDSITLNNSVSGGIWSSNSVTIATVNNSGKVKGLTAGSVGISYTVTNGCSTAYTIATVIVNPLPNPIISYSNAGPCLYVNTYPNYQWYLNGAILAGENLNILFLNRSGYYTLSTTDSNLCNGISAPFLVTGESLNVSTTEANNIQINLYPNPVSSKLFICSSEQVHITINRYDGLEILNNTIATEIDFKNLNTGIYILKVYDNYNRLLRTEKIIKSN